jgi:hypothetical protein
MRWPPSPFTDADKSPLYQWRNGAYDGVDSKHNLEPEFQVTLDGETIAWIAAVPSDFYFIEANKDPGGPDGPHPHPRRGPQYCRRGSPLPADEPGGHKGRRSPGLPPGPPLPGGSGACPSPTRASPSFQDISRASARLQDTLTKEERQRRQWTQDIAHDLKTPVTALQGQLEAVRDGVFNLTQERFESLEREFGQIDKLVRDLSLLSQVNPRK